MKQKYLGSRGPAVSAIGLGCMRMSRMAAPVDLTKDAESIATIQSAIEHGITYLDTGDFYGMGHNEALVMRAAWHAVHGRALWDTSQCSSAALRLPNTPSWVRMMVPSG
jgi:aryl-alcohol dehydrogenase-like predicted oxidoreductase